jgi:hypothetical protein
MLLRRIYVSGNNKTYLGIHVNSLYFCPILNKVEVSRQIFINIPHTKFHGKPFSRSGADTCGRTDTTKPLDVFRDYVNAPEKKALINWLVKAPNNSPWISIMIPTKLAKA